MSRLLPDAIEAYLASLTVWHDDVLAAVAREGHALGLPIVDAQVGALLHLLATALGARRILEIGTAVGYSAIWLARALPPDGTLLTIEIDPDRASRARANVARAGLADRITVIVGDAARVVRKLAGPFDLIFNDGDKRQYAALLDRLVELVRPRGLLVTDNVLWGGEVVPGFVPRPERPPEITRAIAEYTARLVHHPSLITSIVPLRDGIALSVRRPL